MKKFAPEYFAALIIASCIAVSAPGQIPNTWTIKSPMPGGTRATAFAFSIGSKGYVGGGMNFTTGPFNDFWEYDPATDAWTQKNNFGGGSRSAAVSFVAGGKGYVLTGADNTGKKNDIWEYNPSSNSWTQKLNLPAVARNYSVAFAIGDKGYIGTGYTSSGFTSVHDFWQYDPAANAWSQKADVPGPERSSATGFAIGAAGYIGTGDTCNSTACFALNDFYAYDTLSNSWTAKANVGANLRNDAVAFVINGKGYVCTGEVNFSSANDLLEYDPASDTWTTRASKPGLGKTNAFGFSVGNHGYVGTGYDNSFNTTSDMYEYMSDTTAIPTTAGNISNQPVISVFPNPVTDEGFIKISSANISGEIDLEIFSPLGIKIFSRSVIKESTSGDDDLQFHFSKNDLHPGVYMYSLKSQRNIFASGKIVVE